MHIDELTRIVINQCINILKKIGPGCFEKVYEEILYYELTKMGLNVKRQLLFPIIWDECLLVDNAYKLDLLIEDQLIAELKSIYYLPPVYFKQIHSHLSLLNLKYGMLINFKVTLMKDGIYRIFNNKGLINL
jgi:GxxExxY protein